MRRITYPFGAAPPARRRQARQEGGGRLWRLVLGVALIVLVGYLVSDLVYQPSKRGVELVAGLVFIALGIVAGPVPVLGFAIFMLPYPMHTSVGTTSTLLVLAVGALVVMKRRQYRLAPAFQVKSVDLAVMGVVLTMVVSLSQVSSEFYGQAMLKYVGFGAALTLFYLVLQIVTSFKAYVITLKLFMVSATTVGAVSMLQTLFPQRAWLPPFFRFSQRMAAYEGNIVEKSRVYASLPGISPFAEFIAIAIVLQYILYRQARTLGEKAFWLASILMMLIGMAGSATRMGVLILAFGFVYMLVMGSRAIPRLQILNLMFVAVAIFSLSYGFISPLTERMEERMSTLGTKDSSAQSRWGVMTQAYDRFQDSPWLGHGIVIPERTFRGDVSQNIHNLYLTLAYTIGLPGVVAFVIFLFILFRRSLFWMNNLALPPPVREHVLAMNTALVMFAVYQMTSDYVAHVQSMHFVWLRFGLLLALTQVCSRLARAGFKEEEAGLYAGAPAPPS